MDDAAKKKTGAFKRAVGALDYLSGLDAYVVTLENKSKVTIDARRELTIPDDEPSIIKAAKEAPARFAFLSYQTDRALRLVRLGEVNLARLEAKKQITWRFTWLDIHEKRERELEEKNPSYRRGRDPYVSDALIKAGSDMDDGVEEARKTLADLRHRYGALRAVRDAAEHRLYVLRKLLGQKEDPAE